MKPPGLVQLEYSNDLEEMYGENYGYRSGLNKSMADHLQNKVEKLLQYISLSAGDLVIDVGSNDSTTLQAYDFSNLTLVGIDPTGTKFASFYPPNITLIPGFFRQICLHSSAVIIRLHENGAQTANYPGNYYDCHREILRAVYAQLAKEYRKVA